MTAAPLVSDLDPFAPEVMADPYPMYATLLASDQPVYLPRRDMWVVTCHDDVRAAVKDHERFSSADGIAYDRSRLPILFGVDPPDHTRLRKLISRDFTPRTVQSWRPLVEQICAELIDEAVAAGDVDLVREVLVPLPVRVIAALLGIPGDDVAQFKKWSEGVIEGFNANARLRPEAGHGPTDPEDAQRRQQAAKLALSAVSNISVYFHTLLEQRRVAAAGHRPDLAAAGRQHDHLRDNELVWLCLALLVGGNETTTHLLGNLCIALMDHPDQHELVRSRPELMGAAIEETLRYDPPVQSVFRSATHRCRDRLDGDPGRLPGAAVLRRGQPRPAPLRRSRTGSGWSGSPTPATCPSAAASTSASAPRWSGSRPRPSCGSCSSAPRRWRRPASRPGSRARRSGASRTCRCT